MDSKRETFRKYLNEGNVVEALTRALVNLYEEPERPNDSMNYIRQQLGAREGVDVDEIVRENQELKAKILSLQQEIAAIQADAQSQAE